MRHMRHRSTFILPEVIPAGHVLVHNSVRPYPGRGHPDGFHPRFLPPDTQGLVVCAIATSRLNSARIIGWSAAKKTAAKTPKPAKRRA
jgi:hypothetical protein